MNTVFRQIDGVSDELLEAVKDVAKELEGDFGLMLDDFFDASKEAVDNLERSFTFNTPIEAPLTVTYVNKPLMFYLAGFRMPNNWLKAHGYPMRRKKSYMRGRKKTMYGKTFYLVSREGNDRVYMDADGFKVTVHRVFFRRRKWLKRLT